MTRTVPSTGISVASAALLMLAGCGGGGGGGDGPTTPPPKTTVSGVAATGAPFAGAALTLTDATGATVCATTVDARGNYACELPAGTPAPLVATASRDDQALYSVAATNDGRLNVTSLTTVIASRLAPDGNPANLASAIRAQPATASAAAIAQQETQLRTLLQPLLGAVGDTVSPLTGTFAADGTGHDRVLDSLAVSVRPDGAAANIELIVKTVPSGGVVAPVSLKFRSNDAAPAPLPATVTAATLAPAGQSQAVAALLARLNACYALPLSQRVTAASDAVAVTGGPSAVIAPTCRSLFVNDDPASYLSNGSRVGRNAANAGSFSGLFRPGSTGVVFDRGQLEFYRPNGDLLISYHTRSTGGAEDNQTFVARDVGGTLKLIGNQNVYSASVTAFVQDREYINQTAYSWFSTGYEVIVANQVDAQGNPIFSKVVATLPDGSTLDFVPTTGLSYLAARRAADAAVSTTSLVRLAARYRDTGTPGNPATLEGDLFVRPSQSSDAQILALSDQSVWRLEFFHADTRLPNVVQNYRTVSRPDTLNEAAQRVFADLTPAMRSQLVAATSAQGRLSFGAVSAAQPNVVNISAAGDQDAWTVPRLATAPTQLGVFGRRFTNGEQGPLFNDTVGIASSVRKGQVTCSAQTAADTHCDGTTGVVQYAADTRVSALQLSSTSARQVVFYKQANFYRPAP